MLAGVPAARSAELAVVADIRFQAGKAANKRYWDQATVLSHLAILDHPSAAAGVGGTAQLPKLR